MDYSSLNSSQKNKKPKSTEMAVSEDGVQKKGKTNKKKEQIN